MISPRRSALDVAGISANRIAVLAARFAATEEHFVLTRAIASAGTPLSSSASIAARHASSPAAANDRSAANAPTAPSSSGRLATPGSNSLRMLNSSTSMDAL